MSEEEKGLRIVRDQEEDSKVVNIEDRRTITMPLYPGGDEKVTFKNFTEFKAYLHRAIIKLKFPPNGAKPEDNITSFKPRSEK